MISNHRLALTVAKRSLNILESRLKILRKRKKEIELSLSSSEKEIKRISKVTGRVLSVLIDLYGYSYVKRVCEIFKGTSKLELSPIMDEFGYGLKPALTLTGRPIYILIDPVYLDLAWKLRKVVSIILDMDRKFFYLNILDEEIKKVEESCRYLRNHLIPWLERGASSLSSE
ncbi:hypothetical protein B6U74_02920 [Candidatus Bathyarchaeota archaeon ex4484_205]|nr:MAG: hypothetical protein B6U74_02920 [Candidatus Bathyarchaeota archaeon ex4484_205]